MSSFRRGQWDSFSTGNLQRLVRPVDSVPPHMPPGTLPQRPADPLIIVLPPTEHEAVENMLWLHSGQVEVSLVMLRTPTACKHAMAVVDPRFTSATGSPTHRVPPKAVLDLYWWALSGPLFCSGTDVAPPPRSRGGATSTRRAHRRSPW